MEVRRTTFRSFAAFTSFCKPLLNKLAYLGITKTFAEQPTPDLRSGMRGKVFANDLAFVVIVYPSCKRGVQGKVERTCDALDKRICLRVAVKHYPNGVVRRALAARRPSMPLTSRSDCTPQHGTRKPEMLTKGGVICQQNILKAFGNFVGSTQGFNAFFVIGLNSGEFRGCIGSICSPIEPIRSISAQGLCQIL